MRNSRFKSGCICAMCAMAIVVGGASGATAAQPDAGGSTSRATSLSVPITAPASKPVQALEVWQDSGSTKASIVFRQPRTGPAEYLVDLYNVTSGKSVWSTTTSTPPTAANPLSVDIPTKGNFAVRVKATNAGGSSTLARAMIDGKIAPINMLATGWIKEGDDYRLQLNWNAPNYSPAGQINNYRIYDGKGKVITEVTDENVLLTVSQSKKLQGGVAIEPVANNGAVGPQVKRPEVYPAPGEAVSITDIAANADAHTPLTAKIHQDGFAVGDKGVVEVLAPGSGWERVGEFSVTGADQEVKIPLTVRGKNQVRIGISASGSEPVLSDERSVEVFDQQVTKLNGQVVTNKKGERYLNLTATAEGVKSGAAAHLQVQRPGEGSFSEVDTESVKSDGTVAFDQEKPEAKVDKDGSYQLRVVLEPPAQGLPEYISPAIKVEASSATGKSELWAGTTTKQVYAGVWTADAQGNAYYVTGNANPKTIKLTPSGSQTEMTYGQSPAGFTGPVQGGYPDAAPDGTVIQWALVTDQKTNQRWYAIFQAKPGSTVFEFRQLAVKYEQAPARPYAPQLGPNNDIFITSPGSIVKLDKDGKQTIVAGTGTAGFNGESGQANKTQINYPSKFTWNAAGDIFFSDAGNNRIRKIDTSGKMTTVAGNGTAGSGGDGGAATKAELSMPGRLAIDKDGTMYVPTVGYESVSGNILFFSKVRKIDAKGVITTVAGTGSVAGELNPGASPTALNLYKASSVALLPDGALAIDSMPSSSYTDYNALVVLRF